MEETKEPGYECEICEKTFKSKSVLQSHEIIHKEYHKCEICEKGFARLPDSVKDLQQILHL